MIWKQRRDNGAPQVGHSGQTGFTVPQKGSGRAGGEGEVLEAMEYLGVLRIKGFMFLPIIC